MIRIANRSVIVNAWILLSCLFVVHKKFLESLMDMELLSAIY